MLTCLALAVSFPELASYTACVDRDPQLTWPSSSERNWWLTNDARHPAGAMTGLAGPQQRKERAESGQPRDRHTLPCLRSSVESRE